MDIESILRKSNIDSYIAFGRESSMNNDHIIRIGNKFDYYLHGALTRLLDTHSILGSGTATQRFIEQVKKINPDEIHLKNLHGY